MTKITESAIEKFAIELLGKHSYQFYAPDIAPDMPASNAQAGSDISKRIMQ